MTREGKGGLSLENRLTHSIWQPMISIKGVSSGMIGLGNMQCKDAHTSLEGLKLCRRTSAVLPEIGEQRVLHPLVECARLSCESA